jgi:LysM repeat protein
MRLQDYSDLILKKPTPGYRDSQIVAHSYYKKPIDNTEGRLSGISRRVGHAGPEVQKQVIDIIISKCEKYGLSNRQCAYVLATARHESGFNPDAAAGTTSALGIGQFVAGTAKQFGLTNKNRFDADAQSDALVRLFLYNSKIAHSRKKGEEYIYKYHHDGETEEHGGLKLSQKHVMPWVDKIEKKLNKELGHTHETSQNAQREKSKPWGERIKDFFGASSAADLAESENTVTASRAITVYISSGANKLKELLSGKTTSDPVAANNEPSTSRQSAGQTEKDYEDSNGNGRKNHSSEHHNNLANNAETDLKFKDGLGIYEIKAGDTLGRIAKEHGTTVEDIMKINTNIEKADKIYAGDRICLPQQLEATKHYKEHMGQLGENISDKECDRLVGEFSAVAPNASLEQRKQAAITTVALNSIFDSTYGDPKIRESMKRGVKDMLAEALQSGDRIMPIQKYDPKAEPTRVASSFTLDQLHKELGQDKGIERQREMQFGI